MARLILKHKPLPDVFTYGFKANRAELWFSAKNMLKGL